MSNIAPMSLDFAQCVQKDTQNLFPPPSERVVGRNIQLLYSYDEIIPIQSREEQRKQIITSKNTDIT